MPLLLIVGYGPGNSHAIARRFGAEGWTIALVARTEERLLDGVARLADNGVTAHAFPGDAGSLDSMRATVGRVREALGPIASVAFCAYRPVEVGDVLTAAPETLDRVFDVSVGGLITVVQSSLADMRESDDASVLVLNGGLGIHDPDIDRAAVSFGGDGVALECAAKSKLAGLLAERLRPEDVFVGELVITGSVKGSPYAGPTSIDPVDIADRLWTMARDRTENRAFIGEQP